MRSSSSPPRSWSAALASFRRARELASACSGAGRTLIDLHPAIGALQGGEPAALVDLVRVPRGENKSLYAVDRKVLDDARHQPGTQPPTAVMLVDEHVTDPGEGGPVGDNTRESRLLVLSVDGVRARPSD